MHAGIGLSGMAGSSLICVRGVGGDKRKESGVRTGITELNDAEPLYASIRQFKDYWSHALFKLRPTQVTNIPTDDSLTYLGPILVPHSWR